MNRLRIFLSLVFVAALCSQPLAAPAQPQMMSAKPAAPTASAPLDINSATPSQLKSLPGVGDAYAERIIKGRPYAAKNQLVSRGIIPQPVYDKIQTLIIAKRGSM